MASSQEVFNFQDSLYNNIESVYAEFTLISTSIVEISYM